MEKFDFNKRYQNIDWSIKQIEALLILAKRHNNSSFVIYAALEGRNIIERIEYEILVMAAHKFLDESWKDLIESKNGIQKVNSKYKALRFKYQSFTEAFTNALIDDLSTKPFKFKLAEEIQSELAPYIHVYTRNDDDLNYGSLFISNGILLLQKIIKFLKNSFTLDSEGYVLATLDFDSLSVSYKIEFKNWIDSKEEQTDELTHRLIEINNKENNGKKLKLNTTR